MLIRWRPAPVRRLTGDIAGVGMMLSAKGDDRRLRPDRRRSSLLAPTTAEPGGGGSAIVSRAAHELRTPLAVIMGFAGTLVDAAGKMDRETEVKCAEAIVRGATQLQTILDSMLIMDQVERDGVRLDLIDLELGELVLETVRDLQSLTGKHSVSVDVIDDVEVRADASKVRQIITNLISNAVKFSPAGTAITVSVSHVDSHGSVTVEDEGPGIPDHALEKVFHQYERLGSSQKGMGLGLYISRRLALAHGGDLSVRNREAGGACFELMLPHPTEAI